MQLERKEFNISRDCLPFSDVDISERPIYKPFSYYVRGGLDIDGDSLNMNAETSFDEEDNYFGADVVPDATSDPRISSFDIVERAGKDAYYKYQEEAKKSVTPPVSVVESDD